MQEEQSPAKRGFTVQQWTLLFLSFMIGAACVMTIVKVFLTEPPLGGTTQAAAVSKP